MTTSYETMESAALAALIREKNIYYNEMEKEGGSHADLLALYKDLKEANHALAGRRMAADDIASAT